MKTTSKKWILYFFIFVVPLFCGIFEDNIMYVLMSLLDKILSATISDSNFPIGSVVFCGICLILTIYFLYLTFKELTNTNKKKRR